MMMGRVVLFASPYVGHLNPMLHLASLLHATGRFSVTIVHTTFNCPLADRYPNFQLVPILADTFQLRQEDHMAFLVALNANCREPFRREMERLLHTEQVACVIADVHMYCSRVVADQLKLRRIVLRTTGAASFRTFLAFPSFRDKGYLQIPDGQRELPVPEMAPLRYRDLPAFPRSSSDSTYEVLTQFVAATTSSDAVIINTFEALEPTDLRKLQSDLRLPVIPVGPLHKLSSASTTGMPEGESCTEWLERKLPRSVLYVSFGSLACMDMHALREVAWGLANSEQNFLWVVRPGSVRGTPSISAVRSLVEELEEKSGGRGRMVEWAAQQEVLGHPSVGGFWTHCGWNSVLESVCEGVPMLCSPCFGDQLGNARVVTHVWEVGIQLSPELERREIERAIRRLMVEEEGREMRRKATRLKEDADRCTVASFSFLDTLLA